MHSNCENSFLGKLMMKKITNEYLIPFIGLKIGKHQFDYQINKKFFDAFDYHEFEKCDIKVNILFEKKSTMLELSFKHKGTVYVPCDVCEGKRFMKETLEVKYKGKNIFEVLSMTIEEALK